MNYPAHYDRLIARARGRALVGYKERHHVLPRCMGGGDKLGNLVDLTPEEHYVAHQLLVKLHPGVGPLVSAAILMSGRGGGNKAYGWLRRRLAKWLAVAMRGNQFAKNPTPAARAKIGAAMRGKSHSPETLLKMSRASRGNKHALGVVLSPERRANLAAANRGNKHTAGRPLSAEHKAKLSAALRGRPAKPSFGRKGKVNSPEHRRKLSAAASKRVGELNPKSRLSESDVLAIRADSRGCRALARECGVWPRTIIAVKRRETWKHI